MAALVIALLYLYHTSDRYDVCLSVVSTRLRITAHRHSLQVSNGHRLLLRSLERANSASRTPVSVPLAESEKRITPPAYPKRQCGWNGHFGEVHQPNLPTPREIRGRGFLRHNVSGKRVAVKLSVTSRLAVSLSGLARHSRANFAYNSRS